MSPDHLDLFVLEVPAIVAPSPVQSIEERSASCRDGGHLGNQLKHGKRVTGKNREAKSKVRPVVVGVLAVAATGAVVALSVPLNGTARTSAPTSAPIPAPTFASRPPVVGAEPTGGEVPAPPGITNPTPYQYDAATNRHYDPDHRHWHAGPPPSAGLRGTTSGIEVPAPPGITNPTPYQYDAATDRHYDPAHAHWHSGPPPR
jgi:hypothetical protein